MTFADLSPLANHLWQSTVCVAVAWLLTLALRKNRAAVRYWIWLAASVKFLVPFSLLVSAGAQLGWRTAPAIAHSQFSFAMDEIGRPFAAAAPAPLPAVAAPALNPLPAVLLGVWLCGIAIGMVFWMRWWRQMRAVWRAATPLDLNLPIQVMSSPARLEPGVIGILKPVLLLPEGIAERLTPPQLEAILAHELRHVERRDNLTAAIHMLVETIFWFHPLAWWIRTRLMEERERACDEEVMRMGREPQVYAESILKVCEFYLASPVACAAGVTGGELKKRIEGIMANRFARELGFGKRMALVAAAIIAISGPVAVGLLDAPRGRAQARPEFEAASVKPSPPGFANGIRFRTLLSGGPGTSSPGVVRCTNCTLSDLVLKAYDIEKYQLSGPTWLDTELLVTARVPNGATNEQFRLMLQNLLAERFKLAFHREKKDMPGYALVVGKGGFKLKEAVAAEPAHLPQEDRPRTTVGRDGFVVVPPGYPADGVFSFRNGDALFSTVAGKASMGQVARELTRDLQKPVADATGLKGKCDFVLYWALELPEPPSAPGGDLPVASTPLPTLSEALQKLGLKLEPKKKVPADVLVIDHVEKVPTEN